MTSYGGVERVTIRIRLAGLRVPSRSPAFVPTSGKSGSRTQLGMPVARSGLEYHRPAKLTMARALHDDLQHSIADVCRTRGVSRATLSRALQTHPNGPSD